MFRYIALVWDTHQLEQTNVVLRIKEKLLSARDRWHEAVLSNGMLVFVSPCSHSAGRAYKLQADYGAILGTIFRSATCPRRLICDNHQPISTEESDAIISSEGRHLIEGYWGRYIAIFRDHNAQRVFVLKDPCGNLPCFHVTARGIHLIFSSMEDCKYLGILRLEIDWQFVRSRVACGPLPSDRTGLRGVKEVHGGTCLVISRDGIQRRQYWNPLAISQACATESLAQAAQRVREILLSSVNAWASCYDQVILRLSGGLDSSSVLAGLSQCTSPPRQTYITYYVSGGISDQRPWARQAASITRPEAHLERERNPHIPLSQVVQLQPRVVPEALAPYLEVASFERELMTEGRVALFTGYGGDSLFGRHSRQFAATEYVRRHGPDLGVFRVARDVALLDDRSVWAVLADTMRWRLRGHRLRTRLQEISRFRQLVPADIITDELLGARLTHPWFSRASEVPWSLILQLDLLAHPPIYYNPLRSSCYSEPEPVFPLISQPLVEYCLRVPLYMHIDEALDRAVVRRGLSDILPAAVLKRQWKDRSPGFFESVVQFNRSFAREFLLGGVLARERLLDPSRVDAALSDAPKKSSTWASEVLDHIWVEAWLRTWTGTYQPAGI